MDYKDKVLAVLALLAIILIYGLLCTGVVAVGIYDYNRTYRQPIPVYTTRAPLSFVLQPTSSPTPTKTPTTPPTSSPTASPSPTSTPTPTKRPTATVAPSNTPQPTNTPPPLRRYTPTPLPRPRLDVAGFGSAATNNIACGSDRFKALLIRFGEHGGNCNADGLIKCFVITGEWGNFAWVATAEELHFGTTLGDSEAVLIDKQFERRCVLSPDKTTLAIADGPNTLLVYDPRLNARPPFIEIKNSTFEAWDVDNNLLIDQSGLKFGLNKNGYGIGFGERSYSHQCQQAQFPYVSNCN